LEAINCDFQFLLPAHLKTFCFVKKEKTSIGTCIISPFTARFFRKIDDLKKGQFPLDFVLNLLYICVVETGTLHRLQPGAGFTPPTNSKTSTRVQVYHQIYPLILRAF